VNVAIAPEAGNERKRSALDLSWPILIGFAAILCVLILLPIGWLVYYSFKTKAGAFTLGNFTTLISNPDLLEPLITTLIISTSSAVICCLAAAPMGWLIARTDMPLRRTVRALVTASFVTPPFLGAIAWELLAAPNSGLLNQIFRVVTGAPPDEHLFTSTRWPASSSSSPVTRFLMSSCWSPMHLTAFRAILKTPPRSSAAGCG
jgi:iron(III) transport system permease protein